LKKYKYIMKNLMLIVLALFIIGGCDDDDNDANSKVTEIQTTVTSNQWIVTYFVDNDSYESDKFTGYVFEFGSDGIVRATIGSTAVSGSWSVTSDDSGDDNSNGEFEDIDFNISFSSPPDFEELSEDWQIISLTNTKIELRHVSGGNGGTDLLTFENI
jgi:hypothetical protein